MRTATVATAEPRVNFRDTKRDERANAALAKTFVIINFAPLTACWIDRPRQARGDGWR